MDRKEAVERLKETFAVLNSDLREAIAYARSSSTPYSRRAVFRAHFALIEGLFHLLREVAVASSGTAALLSAAQIDLLLERGYRLDEKGRPEPTPNFQPFLKKLLLTMRAYAAIHGASFEPDTSIDGWNQLRRAVKVRDRITHPKSPSDIQLTEEDMNTLPLASAWWQGELLRLSAVSGMRGSR